MKYREEYRDPAAARRFADAIARTVTRRAERAVWALLEVDPEGTSKECALYLNRLSDLLFILSRAANPGGDVLWQPGGER